MKISDSTKKAMIGAGITLVVVIVALAIWKMLEPKVDNAISAAKVKAVAEPVDAEVMA